MSKETTDFLIETVIVVVLIVLAYLCWKMAKKYQKRLNDLPEDARRRTTLLLKHVVFYGYLLSIFLPIVLAWLVIGGLFDPTHVAWEFFDDFMVNFASGLALSALGFITFFISRFLDRRAKRYETGEYDLTFEKGYTTENTMHAHNQIMAGYFQVFSLLIFITTDLFLIMFNILTVVTFSPTGV